VHLDRAEQRARDQLFELVERAGVEHRDLQPLRVQAVALAETVSPCELVQVVRDDHGKYALERRLVGRRNTEYPPQLRVWPMRSDARPVLTIIVTPATSRSSL